MRTLTASEAKQHFGEVLAAAGLEPIAIQRHGQTVAMIVGPDFSGSPSIAKRLARAENAAVEQARLDRHYRIALTLLSDARRAPQLVNRARKEVARWEERGLCSQEYIERWNRLLQLDRRRLAVEMCGDLAGWGNAMRQNSPWVVDT